MSKRELIDAILEHNRRAAPEFLARFQEVDLKAYLDRITAVRARKVISRPAVEVDSMVQMAMA